MMGSSTEDLIQRQHDMSRLVTTRLVDGTACLTRAVNGTASYDTISSGGRRGESWMAVLPGLTERRKGGSERGEG